MKFNLSGNYAIALYMAKFMISSQNCEIPIMFLETDLIQKELEVAYGFAYKLNSVLDGSQIPNQLGIGGNLIEEKDETNLSTVVGKYTILCESANTACIIQFPDQGSVLLIVGSSGNGGSYMIDPSNGVFCASTGPEYDIETYIKLYGNKEDYIVQFFQEQKEEIGGEEEKKRVLETTAAAKMAPAKKVKTNTTKKITPSPAVEGVLIENK
jgi:hypothetical protein